MKLIEGGLPEGKAWRVLLLMAPSEPLGRAWQLGLLLARANEGDLIVAVAIPEATDTAVADARELVTTTRNACKPDDPVYFAILETVDERSGLADFADKAGVNLLIAHGDGPVPHQLDNVTCGLIVLRGDWLSVEERDGESTDEPPDDEAPLRILVPTAGGPNTAHALGFLLPLAEKAEITAAYIAANQYGPNQDALGWSRLKKILNYVDAGDRVASEVIEAQTVTDGIVAEAVNYDLVMIGASRESSVDRVLFGNIPAAVVRDSKKPLAVVRQPTERLATVRDWLSWQIEKVLPNMNLSDRTQAYVRIRRSARPDQDYYILITLSAMIASLGLIINSPAVVIGAMLVAPLMSPIVGTGLAVVLGDAVFLRRSIGTVLKGAFLGIFVGMLAGLLFLDQPLNNELMARTQPSLIDLGIALFSGLAGAYALCRSDAAGALPGVAIAAALVPPLSTIGVTFTTGFYTESLGATLLFVTNFVAVSSATALMFLVLGFRPTIDRKTREEVRSRSVTIALLLLVVVAGMLGVFTYQLAQEQARDGRIRQVVRDDLAMIDNAELDEVELLEFVQNEAGETVLRMEVVALAERPILYQEVFALQQSVGSTLQSDGILDLLELRLTVIEVTDLDPLVPPTATATATVTNTPTPGSTPTASHTPTATPSPQPTATATATVASTSTPPATATASATPTITPSPTITPQVALVTYPFGLNMRAEPSRDSEVLALLPVDTAVVLLPGQETAAGLEWQQIFYAGQEGWVSIEFLTIQP